MTQRMSLEEQIHILLHEMTEPTNSLSWSRPALLAVFGTPPIEGMEVYFCASFVSPRSPFVP